MYICIYIYIYIYIYISVYLYLYSFIKPCIGLSEIIPFDALAALAGVDKEAGTITVQAGARVSQILQELCLGCYKWYGRVGYGREWWGMVGYGMVWHGMAW